MFSLVAVLTLGACGPSKGNFSGEGLLGNIPEQLAEGAVIMPKYIKEGQSHRSDGLSDFVEWENKFYEETLPEDYLTLLNREISSVEEKMDKIAKITLVPWSKYEKISKDLNKDEAI